MSNRTQGLVSSESSRRRIYSEIFGVERPLSSSSSTAPSTSESTLPNRIEDIECLNDVIHDDIQEDILSNDTDYILSNKTHMRKISDTTSLSSMEDTTVSPRTSPSKQLNQSPVKEHARTRPMPPPQSTSVLPSQWIKCESSPQPKPTLAPLTMSNIPKGVNKSQSSTTPTSKKSPLQGFGLFSRPNSRDLHEQQRQQHPSNLGSRSMSLNSSTFKNFASSLQQKTASGRTIPQKYDATSNPFLEYQPTPSGNMNNNNNNNTSVGLGLRSRNSSASLNSNNGATTRRVASSSSLHHFHSHRHSSTSLHSKPLLGTSMKRPQVYPAMLSRVATRFKKSMVLGEHKKDGLLYRDAFTGQQAVDVICSIIRTSDRNLALLLGRALDAQKLFHDVVYEHRLRDSPKEVYEFTGNSRVIGTGTTGMIPASSHQDPLMMMSSSTTLSQQHFNATLATLPSSTTISSDDGSSTAIPPATTRHIDPATVHNVNGVFTLLAECYSPTCTRDRLCYSISCPRRLEQQARLNLKPNGGLKRNISMAIDDDEEEKPSWTSSVPEEIWSSLSKKDIKRQEAIYEVYITEKTFVKNLEIIRDTFMKTLAETNIIPADIRKNFIKHVFAHVNDIYSVNRRFLDALSDRQKSSPIVDSIGDILLRFIPFFEPFVTYVASRPYAKYLIETQRSVNPYFARFDEDLMNSPLRHGIDSFLSQGVSRPGRYILLVREIMKSSDPDKNKRDLENLTRAFDALRDFMRRIDKASGAAQDRHDVKLLKQKILFKNEYVNLGLNDEKRKIKHEGVLSRKELTKSDSSVVGDIQFYLLDNMLLFLKSKPVNKWQQHKVFQRPIPLPLLFACPGEDMPLLKKCMDNRPDCSGMVLTPEYNLTNTKNAITFLYYGAKQRYQVTLYAAQYAALQTLLEKIKQEQNRLVTSNDIFNITKISDRFFDYSNKVNSVASCDGGRKLLIATNLGLYVSNIKRQQSTDSNKATTFFTTPVKIVNRNNVTQVAVLEEFQSILLLVDKKLYSCPMALLQQEDAGGQYFKKHAKEMVNHVNFFAEGDCNGKRLVVTAHSSSHSIKFFEHEHPMLMEGKKNLKRKIIEVSFDSEPVSISFLKANLCIGCKKGFQIVSVSQKAHEPLLDPADTSLEFALKDMLKPMAIYRVGNMFLLCYSEFAFFVNNQGWRKKESHIVHWEGEPQKFAIWYPYILAFDNNFIEIRKVDTGELVRCVLGEKIRLLQTSSQEILYAYEDARGYDTVASLDFWGK